LQLRDKLDLKAAVETGTYLGDSARVLAQHFDRVWTIEIAEHLWKAAKESHTLPNVEFILGASQDVLSGIDPGGPSLYWLDGHWSAGVTGGQAYECPVLAEVQELDKLPQAASSAVLIDDARLFLAPPGPPHDRAQWPMLTDVLDALRDQHQRYVTIIEDVIVAVPPAARTVVEDYGTSVAWQPPAPEAVDKIVLGVRRAARRIARTIPGRHSS
jgi:hypothetical protein